MSELSRLTVNVHPSLAERQPLLLEWCRCTVATWFPRATRRTVPAHPTRPRRQLPIVRDYLPQVSLTWADTRFTLSLMSRDWPFFPLGVVQRETMYQLLSPELSF